MRGIEGRGEHSISPLSPLIDDSFSPSPAPLLTFNLFFAWALFLSLSAAADEGRASLESDRRDKGGGEWRVGSVKLLCRLNWG